MNNQIESLFSLNNQTAVITGGSGTLGRGMALGLAAAGARIVILGRRLEACERVADEIKAAGGQALGLACDVGKLSDLEQAATQVQATFGPTQILVNAAGGNQLAATVTAEQSFFDLKPPAMQEIFASNFTGTFQACQVFGRGMAERKEGVIVNIVSMASLRPLARIVGYSAAKAAAQNFTQWLAVHLAQTYSPQIRVNAIAPGFFLAEQNRALLVNAETGAWTERAEKILAHTPMGRLGMPEDLVGTLLWLVSPASTFVTGIVVSVDGGFSAYSGL